MPEVGVVVVTWNSAATIGACLGSIPSDVPVVVVDNASRDQTVKRVRESHPEAQIVALDRNLGFGAACNVGAERLGSCDVLLLNPDAMLAQGAIDQLAAILAQDSTLGIVGPLITDSEGRLELSWGHDPTLVTEWRRQREHRRLPSVESLERARVDWVTGACCLVRRAAWEAVGGFDEGFFLYFEDLDLCRRVRAHGWGISFDPSARATHVRGASADTLGELKAERYRVSQLRYYRTHAGPVAIVGLRVYLVAKYVAAMLRRPSMARVYGRILRRAVINGETSAVGEPGYSSD